MKTINRETLNAVKKELAVRSLAEFTKQAWHVLEPATELKWGWALDAMCDHLQKITLGQFRDLLINVPPGMMKSLLTGVFWPAWEWGPQGRPYERYLGTAHREGLSTRDNVRCRRLIESEWYQSRWPTIIVSDQNTKTKFENDKTGLRESMAFTAMTGSRGSRILIDDPLSVKGSSSEADLQTAEDTFRESLPTRLNDENSSTVVIMQRLHARDTSGIILENKMDFVHLCLPMRYDGENRSTHFTDPRTELDELLFPERFSEKYVIEKLESRMTGYSIAGQLQQRPVAREGGLFKIDKLEYLDHCPTCIKWVRGWDLASTKDGGAYTCGVLIGEVKGEFKYVIADVIRGRWGPGRVREVIYDTAEKDFKRLGPIGLSLPQDPGQAGKSQVSSLSKTLAAFSPSFQSESGSKFSRAEPLAAQVELGKVGIVRAKWNDPYTTELASFPRGTFKDQVDASATAFNKLENVAGWIYG